MTKYCILFVLCLFCSVSNNNAITNSNNGRRNIKASTKVMKKAKKNIITHVTVTCYQPVESQCDSDPLITADGSKIDLKKLKNGEIK